MARRLLSRCGQWVFAMAAALLFAGCATLPDEAPRPPTKAIAASADTALGKIALASQPDPDLSGFRLMPGGDFAFDTRIQLARRAQRTLDVQYYQIDRKSVV